MKKKSGKNRHKKTSDKQITANRQNAKASTGPGSPEGLENACHNATTHGGYSGKVLMKWESQAEFDAFYQGLWRHLSPENELEDTHLDEYIWEVWRLRRLRVYEANLVQDIQDPLLLNLELERLTRIQMRIERSRDRALKAFITHRERMESQEKRDRKAYLQAEMTRPPMMDDETFMRVMQERFPKASAALENLPAEQAQMGSFRQPDVPSLDTDQTPGVDDDENPLFQVADILEPSETDLPGCHSDQG